MPKCIDDKTFRKEIGARFKEIRLQLNLSQKNLSSTLSTTQANVANIERGAIYPNMTILLILTTEYQVNLSWLLTGKGNMFAIDMNALGFDKPPDERYTKLLHDMITRPVMAELIFGKFKELGLLLGNGSDIEKDAR